jgi:hypothetical protein
VIRAAGVEVPFQKCRPSVPSCTITGPMLVVAQYRQSSILYLHV